MKLAETVQIAVVGAKTETEIHVTACGPTASARAHKMWGVWVDIHLLHVWSSHYTLKEVIHFEMINLLLPLY